VLGRQKQVIESYLRVQAFLAANPAPAPASYTEPKVVLDDVVAQLGDHSGAQVFGLQLGKAQQRRQATAVRKLREHHMRPLVTIAQAEEEMDPGIAQSLRLPASSVGVTRLLAAAEAMREAATPLVPKFVAGGRPADFLEQLVAATTALRLTIGGRATIVGTHVGAKAGISQQLRRGRTAVARLDSIVRVAFEGNDVVLARWRVAKRVKGLPGGGGGATPEIEAAPATSPENTPAAA